MPASSTLRPSVRARRDLANRLGLVFGPSYAFLQALADYVATSRDCRVAISTSVIDLLDTTLIPSTGYHPSHDKVLAAMGAISVILSQVTVILDLRASREEMSALLRHHYADFLEWLHFFNSKGIYTIPGAAFILGILDMDEDLRHAFMDTPSTVDLAFSMWMQQDHRGRYHIPANGETACPLLLLIWRIVGTPRGSSTFRTRLQASPHEIQCIADTLQGRLRALRKGQSKGTLSPSFTIGHLRGLSRVVGGLLYQPEHAMVLFQSHQLLLEIPLTLNVCLDEETSPTLWSYASDILGSLYIFVLKSDPQSGSLLTKIISALKGGTIRALLRSLLYIPTSHTNYSFAANFLRDIVGYIAYRSVAPWLIVFVNSEYYITVAGARDPPALFQQCWEEILYAVQAHDKSDGARIGSSVCDSVQHCTAPGQNEEKSKMCSGCQTRFYCSSGCQKADWNMRHRHECNEVRESTTVGTDLGGELRTGVRAGLAAFVERTCNRHLSAFRSLAQRKFSAPLGSLILRVDGVSVPATGGLSTVVEFFSSIRNSFGGSIPQRPRINDYLTQMLGVPDIHLAYAVFPFGLLTIHLLVRMQKEGDDPLTVVSFMTVGISECGTSGLQHIWSARELRQ